MVTLLIHSDDVYDKEEDRDWFTSYLNENNLLGTAAASSPDGEASYDSDSDASGKRVHVDATSTFHFNTHSLTQYHLF